MQGPVESQIFVVYTPDREGRVAQLSVRHDGEIDIPAEVYREGDQTMITLFSGSGGPTWTYPLADFVTAVDAAVAVVEAPGPEG